MMCVDGLDGVGCRPNGVCVVLVRRSWSWRRPASDHETQMSLDSDCVELSIAEELWIEGFCLEIQRCRSGLSIDGCSVLVMELYLDTVVVLLVCEPRWESNVVVVASSGGG